MAGVGLVAAVMACQGGAWFQCSEQADCETEDGGGVCQPTGGCSFPDDGCTSGQRYGSASAPELAGQCVELGQGSTTVEEGSTDASTEPDPTLDPATGSSSGTTDTSDDGCPEGWWDCAWAHRQRLSLARPLPEALTDVPVLVLLTEGRVDHARMQADGEDVRFVSAAGTSLPHEVQRWVPDGVSVIWVDVDALGGGVDHLWIYYGNPVAEGVDAPAGVWGEPYVGVWHLEDEPVDATGHGHDATTIGNVVIAAGQVGSGRDFDSYNARLEVGATDALADVFMGGATVSAWIRPSGWGGGGFGRIVDKDGATGGWSFNVGGGGMLRFNFKIGPSDTITWSTPVEAVAPHRWSHVAMTYDALGTAPAVLFVDGVEQVLEEAPEVPQGTQLATDFDMALSLGNRPANDRRFDGILDEVRIERAVRSPAWIRVQHDAGRDALLEYGGIESWEGS